MTHEQAAKLLLEEWLNDPEAPIPPDKQLDKLVNLIASAMAEASNNKGRPQKRRRTA